MSESQSYTRQQQAITTTMTVSRQSSSAVAAFVEQQQQQMTSSEGQHIYSSASVGQQVSSTTTTTTTTTNSTTTMLAEQSRLEEAIMETVTALEDIQALSLNGGNAGSTNKLPEQDVMSTSAETYTLETPPNGQDIQSESEVRPGKCFLKLMHSNF